MGDQFFELQRGYPDPMRTGLRMSKWDQAKQDQIHQRYRQGLTAMTDAEIKTVGEKHFSRLERIDINIYDLWCNNCQTAVDDMLRDIGGLFYYRAKLESLQEMVRQFFHSSILTIMELYGRYRGWDEEIITRYTNVLHKTLRVMTSRAEYPKSYWVRNDVENAEGVLKKVGTITDHWVLTVLESSLSLRKPSEDLYVRRGVDGKPELNFDAVREATKGIFDDDQKNWRLAWLKAVPWLTAGFLVGTPRWAAAVISIALSRASQLYGDHVVGRAGLRSGLEKSLVGLGVSPQIPSSASLTRPKLRKHIKHTNGQRRIQCKTIPMESKLVARYEQRFTTAGAPFFFDHMNNSQSWDAPDQQEMCLKITDLPLSKKWEERREEGRTLYVNRRTGETTDTRPGATEIWVVKKKFKPEWIKTTMMALPSGWEMRRTEEGEMYYLNHNDDPPTSTTYHPMRREIEDERRSLLPEWNVEWDNERGKKYRNLQNGEIRWKAVDGPRYVSIGDKAKITFTKPKEGFIEPLPPGWKLAIKDDGQKIYSNGKVGKERIESTSHPLTEKRRRLQPDWEMRYTPGHRRYWVHYGSDGRGTTWWTRNRLLKNTSLKNNASGWKLAEDGHEWEWFEGGDVPHSELPVLDLDDPAEIEFREYPFILPTRTTTEKGSFLEPLPSGWVMRTQEDEKVHYWNYKEQARSEQHPNEEERRNLPALWEMRFTLHDRQYYVHHEDGSTWWTHPRENKHEQKLRAGPGQSQNGWKLAEDGKNWQRFEDHPDAQATEHSVEATTHTQAQETPGMRRSLSSTRAWLKRVNSSGLVANARTRIPQSSKIFKRSDSDKSSNISSILADSPQEDAVEEEGSTKEKWLMDRPAMMEEPQSTNPTEQESSPQTRSIMKSFAPTRESMKRLISSEKMPSVISNLINDLQEIVEEKRPVEEESPIGPELPLNTEPSTEEPQSNAESSSASPPQKDSRKTWAKRTTSSFRSLKKNKEKKSSGGSVALAGENVVPEDNLQPLVQGLGISGTEPLDGEVGAEVLTPIEEKVSSKEELNKDAN